MHKQQQQPNTTETDLTFLFLHAISTFSEGKIIKTDVKFKVFVMTMILQVTKKKVLYPHAWQCLKSQS